MNQLRNRTFKNAKAAVKALGFKVGEDGRADVWIPLYDSKGRDARLHMRLTPEEIVG